jgi:glycosyltransferase involved in cell wall biosynthesis
MAATAKVDIVIPTYNRFEMLASAIRSAQNQEYNNLNIIVTDNCSTDNTSLLVKKMAALDSRINYVCNTENAGMLGNLYKAFTLSSNEYFCILTDDDLLTPNFISDALEVFENNKNIGFVALESVYIDDKMNLLREPQASLSGELFTYENDESFFAMTSHKHPFSLISVLFKKEVTDLYLQTDTLNDKGSDIRFLMHAAAKYNWAYLSKIGACVTLHPNSFSVSKKLIDWEHDVIQISRLIEILRHNPKNYMTREICLNLIVSEFSRNRVYSYFKLILMNSLYQLRRKFTAIETKFDPDIREFSRSSRGSLYFILIIVNKNIIIRSILYLLIKTILFVFKKSISVRHCTKRKKTAKDLGKFLAKMREI